MPHQPTKPLEFEAFGGQLRRSAARSKVVINPGRSGSFAGYFAPRPDGAIPSGAYAQRQHVAPPTSVKLCASPRPAAVLAWGMVPKRIALISTGGTIEKTYDELSGVLANQVSVLDVMLASLELRGVEVQRVR